MDFSETIYLEVTEEQAEALYPQVLLLSDKDINGIRNLLKKKPKTKVELEYRSKIVNRIREALEITDRSLPDADFLHQLLKDYNYMTQKK